MTSTACSLFHPILALVVICAAVAAAGQGRSGRMANRPPGAPFPADAPDSVGYSNAPEKAVAKWRRWKFGVLIQWNMSSFTEGEISWGRAGKRWGFDDWGTGNVPVDVYDNLFRKFKAERFDARKLCTAFKDAGIRYALFCNKHHDGFCMWDTKLSDYKITSAECPCGRDLTKEWADACHAAGLKQGVYFSQPDWHDRDYLRSEEAHRRFIDRMQGWVRELLSNYGKVDVIFFDGLGGLARNWDSATLFPMIRSLQPNIMIDNRCGAEDVEGFPVHRWMQKSEDRPAGLPMRLGYSGDYDTPEQTINRMQTDRPWETCMPLQKTGGYDQWSYSSKAEMKSPKEVLQCLVSVVGRDGNLMVCPALKPDGSMDPRAGDLLAQCGKWLRLYGKTIYNTRGGPYYPTPFGVSTYRGRTVFVHLLEWPGDKLTLPPIHGRLVSWRVLTGGTANVGQASDGSISITVPPECRQDIDTIIALQLNKSAASAKPGLLALGSLATGKKVRASNVYGNRPWFAARNAVDDDTHTRWCTDFGTKQAWLEVDLGSEQTFDRVLIREDLGFVRKFEVQVKRGETWVAVLKGTRIGEDFRASFPAVRSRYVRLAILDAVTAPQYPDEGVTSHTMAQQGPSIWEFQVLAGG